MGSEPKEMKYRRRVRAPEPGDYGQCGDRGGGAVDWAALKQQDPAELLRKLDELRDQITRSCEAAGPPPHRMGRRAVPMRPSHADPLPPPPGRGAPPEYYRPSRHAGRYGPPSSYDQRSVCDDRYARQPSGRFRQPRPEGQWEGHGYGGQGSGHHSSCQCPQCVHGQRAVPPQEESIPMARFFAGQQRPPYQFDRSASSISSEYDRRSVASSLYSQHLSISKRRVEYFSKKADSFCRPAKGGAPFVVCSSCNQLLQLPPGKCTAPKQNQVQCGSCSEVVTFIKLKGVKVHPVIPSSSFSVPKSVRSSDRRAPQSSGWYPYQDDDTSSFDSYRQKQNFSDNLSQSSIGSYGSSTNKEHGPNKSSQVKPVSVSKSRFADSPKDILCQGDADSHVEASLIRTICPQAPVLEDKLVDPFSSQQNDCSGGDQIKSKRYGLNSKGNFDVRGERIDVKCEEKRNGKQKDGSGEETRKKTYGQKYLKQLNASCPTSHIGNKSMRKANSDDSSSLEDEVTSKKYEEKSKQDSNNFEVQGINKRYGNCDKEGYNNDLEFDSITKTCEEESIEDDYSKSVSSNCENAKTVAKNESSVSERTNTSSHVSSDAGLDEIQSSAVSRFPSMVIQSLNVLFVRQRKKLVLLALVHIGMTNVLDFGVSWGMSAAALSLHL
ncbi:uncharacterized protein LOC123452136 isoform X2 [Hordeum vulgare subsp. vulgare]|uniref:uncharacterized protein LOC123452136 isoform X2 n=1 Tax=Hordeum vulgare subsp. vulgare TaxID=112509 RepID=UPI001D1A3B13|nr:uncharacterized protein LOC123452136 isoform X2 [Hordeum vulgare subsp. vulgare]